MNDLKRWLTPVVICALFILLVACGAATQEPDISTPSTATSTVVAPSATTEASPTSESTIVSAEPTLTPEASVMVASTEVSIESSATPQPTASPESTATSDAPTPTIEAAPPSLGERAILLVSEYSGLAPEVLTVTSQEEVTWADSSLGCPEAGYAYMDVLTPGVRVIVAATAGGKTFYVHGNEQEHLFVCQTPGPTVDEQTKGGGGAESTQSPESPSEPVPTVVTIEVTATTEGDMSVNPTSSSLSEQAIAIVSEASGIPAEELTIVSAQTIEWPDSSVGCPEPGGNYLQVLTEGIKVVVEGHGKRFAVHGTSANTLFICNNPKPPANTPPQSDQF